MFYYANIMYEIVGILHSTRDVKQFVNSCEDDDCGLLISQRYTRTSTGSKAYRHPKPISACTILPVYVTTYQT